MDDGDPDLVVKKLKLTSTIQTFDATISSKNSNIPKTEQDSPQLD